MHAPYAPAQMQATRRSEPAAGPRGRGLLLARAAWVLVAILSLALSSISVPVRYAQLLTLSRLPAEVTAGEVRASLAQLGLSTGAYAAAYLALYVALALVCAAVGLLIFWRKSDEWMGLFVSLMILTLGAGGDPEALAAIHPLAAAVSRTLGDLTWLAFMIFFFVFPDGRFVPRWTRLLAAVIGVMMAASYIFPGTAIDVDAWEPLLGFLFLAGVLGAGIGAQIYRYRRVSGPVQRQQTKWVVFGFIVVTGLLMTFEAPAVIVPALAQPGPAKVLYELTTSAVFLALSVFFPLSVGIAILRYRLYDIDLLINRALVYGTLTGLLLAVYLGGVVALQGLFRTLTGQESTLAVVVATLAAAALFQPLRRRLQSFIDRRFYRAKYDAARTLAAFSVHLRDEVDLTALSAELVRVVDETMQPAHASLWVRPPNAPGRTMLELTGQPPATTVRGRPATPHPLARRAGEERA